MRSPHAHEVSLLYTLASVTPCFPSHVIYVTSMDLCEDEAVTACITVTCKKAEEMNLHQIGPWGCEHGGAVHSGERVLETSWFEDFLTPCSEFLAWGKGRKIFLKISRQCRVLCAMKLGDMSVQVEHGASRPGPTPMTPVEGLKVMCGELALVLFLG